MDILQFTGVSSWHKRNRKGRGVKALIIDGGWENRPFFHGKLKIAYTTGTSKSQHGMKTAETFHIVAPETEIHCHEYSYPTPPTPGDVLQYIIDNEIQIVSMSTGGMAFKHYPELMVKAMKTALFFTSAGNNGKYLSGMADSENWISVGAGLLTRSGIEVAPYSAPGHNILGLVGIEVHNSKGDLHIPAGTSFACPETAGKVALLAGEMERAYGRKPTPDELKQVVFENLKDEVLMLPEEIPKRKEEAQLNKPEYIIIHHSATKEGGAESFRRNHIARGWRDVGYHYIIGNGTQSRDGQVEKGRAENESGAHCKADGMNFKSIGICLVGDLNVQRPTTAQMESLKRLCRDIMSRHKIPAENILGHGEVKGSATACPGKNFDMNAFRKRLEGSDMTKGKIILKLKIGGKTITRNDGKVFTMDVPAKIENNRTLVPVRAICEALGAFVHFENDNITITL